MRRRQKAPNRGPAIVVGIVIVGFATWMQLRWMANQRAADPIRATGAKQYPCWYCEGHGNKRDPMNPMAAIPCPVCVGVGYRFVDPRNGELCQTCLGMGRTNISAIAATECGVCDGWGWTPRKVRIEISNEIHEEPGTNGPPEFPAAPLPGD